MHACMCTHTNTQAVALCVCVGEGAELKQQVLVAEEKDKCETEFQHASCKRVDPLLKTKAHTCSHSVHECVCVEWGGGGGGGWANKTSPGWRRQEVCETEFKQASCKRADPSWRPRGTHTHTHSHSHTHAVQDDSHVAGQKAPVTLS